MFKYGLPPDVGSRGHRIWIERGLQVGDPTGRKWRELPVELEGKLMSRQRRKETNKNEWGKHLFLHPISNKDLIQD